MEKTHAHCTSPEWPAMWEAIADATGDYADCCPETGECWQYMGTFDGAHQFRHRHRPESCRPIKGFAGKHCDRVYLHLDAETLAVVRVHVRQYIDDTPPAALTSAEAIQRARDGHRTPDYSAPWPALKTQRREDYGGAFDGFSVISDADPGL